MMSECNDQNDVVSFDENEIVRESPEYQPAYAIFTWQPRIRNRRNGLLPQYVNCGAQLPLEIESKRQLFIPIPLCGPLGFFASGGVVSNAAH